MIVKLIFSNALLFSDCFISFPFSSATHCFHHDPVGIASIHLILCTAAPSCGLNNACQFWQSSTEKVIRKGVEDVHVYYLLLIHSLLNLLWWDLNFELFEICFYVDLQTCSGINPCWWVRLSWILLSSGLCMLSSFTLKYTFFTNVSLHHKATFPT